VLYISQAGLNVFCYCRYTSLIAFAIAVL